MIQRVSMSLFVLVGLIRSSSGLADDLMEGDTSVPARAVAKDLFYKPDAAPAGTTALAMRHQIFLQRGCERVTVPDGFAFQTGDRVRLHVKVNQDGFLYIMHRGSSGEWKFLFPDPKIGHGNHAVKAYEAGAIPDDGWFEFDDRVGTEELYLFFSKEPIRELHLVNTNQNEPTFQITVGASVVQRIVGGHEDNVRRGSTKDINWTDDADGDTAATTARGGIRPCPDRPASSQTATYTTSVTTPADGTAIRGISLQHMN